MKPLRTFFFLALVLSSCQTIVRATLGMKVPRPLPDAVVQAYATKTYPEHSFYRVDSITLKKMFREEYKPGWGPGFRPIQFVCFAPSGQVVCQWASCEGNLKATLSKSPPQSNYPSDSNKKFVDFAKGVRPLDEKTPLSLNPKKNTYIVYWATWLNKQSTGLIKNIDDYVIRNGGEKENILLVNVDEYPR